MNCFETVAQHLFGIYLTFNTLTSDSKIQVPLFMATYFAIKYHLQDIFKCLKTK
jgi:hypothetical protein